MQAQHFMGFNFHNPLVFPESPVPLEFTPFLGILVGVVLTLVLVAFVVILILRIKYQQSHHNRHPSGCLTTSIVLFPKNRNENIFWQEKEGVIELPSKILQINDCQNSNASELLGQVRPLVV